MALSKRKPNSSPPAPSMPTLDLAVISGQDQPIAVDNYDSAFWAVDNVINYAVDNKSPEYALDQLSNLAKLRHVAGLALAKGFWLLSRRWAELGMMDSFYDRVMLTMGYSQQTVERYIKAYGALDYVLGAVDEETARRFVGRSIEDLVALGQARTRHGDLTGAQLKRLAGATDNGAFRERLQEIIHGDESEEVTKLSNGMLIVLERDGTLVVMKGRKRKNIGFIQNSPEALTDDLVVRAIDYLVEEAGIQRK